MMLIDSNPMEIDMARFPTRAAWFENFQWDEETGWGFCFYSGWTDETETEVYCSTSILIIF